MDGPEASQGVCNSTPTLATVTCTLAQAIAVSNDTGGATIAFHIPSDPADGNTFDDGLPQIQQTSATAVLDITAPTFIDGTTQPGVGKVELSGEVSYSSVVPGLVVGMGGGGSTIKGMVINGFQEMIVLQGGGNTIEDDWRGMNVVVRRRMRRRWDCRTTSQRMMHACLSGRSQLEFRALGIRSGLLVRGTCLQAVTRGPTAPPGAATLLELRAVWCRRD